MQVKNYTDPNFFDNVIPPNSQQIFTSVYQNFTGNVFSSSDIHGDIHAFIIQLRDCAQVIRSRNGFNPLSGVVDPNIDNNLDMDIRDADGLYDPSLGYEWCGGNSLYVICGDIIDSCRAVVVNKQYVSNLSYCEKLNGDPCHFYPQSEIKLLRFINAINASAHADGATGKIIKLLGNHDYYNTMHTDRNIVNNGSYESEYDSALNNNIPYMGHLDERTVANYYRGTSRLEIFRPDKIGFKYLFDGEPGYGCGAFVMINDTIYCHGQITEHPNCTLYNLINVNDFLNSDPYVPSIGGAGAFVLHQDWAPATFANNFIAMGMPRNKVWEVLSKILNTRNWAKPHFDSPDPNNPNFGLCDNYVDANGVDSIFRSFMMTFQQVVGLPLAGTLPLWIPNLRLVVGHTPQYSNPTAGMFTHLVKHDTQTQTYGIFKPSIINPPNVELVPAISHGSVILTADNTSPGIAGVCIKNNKVDFKIFCVDNSISRGFDVKYSVDSHNSERKVLYRRTPQVLKIDYANPINAESLTVPIVMQQFTNISIVRSKMKNTRIHQPRITYENEVAQYQALALNNARYNTKYLKYKTKYLKLKRMNL